MSSVETDATYALAADQAASALASAVVAAAGIDAAADTPAVADVAEVNAGVDVAFAIEYGSTHAACVLSEQLAGQIVSGSSPDAASDQAWEILRSAVDMGARAVAERVAAIAEGLGAVGAVSPMPDGVGAFADGEARKVNISIAGEPAGWIMWIGSRDMVAALAPRGGNAAVIDAIDYPDLGEGAAADGVGTDISFLSDVTMGVSVELGRTVMKVREVLKLTHGSVIELDRAAGALVDVLISGSLVARGEVVVIDDQLGVRVVEIVDSSAPER